MNFSCSRRLLKKAYTCFDRLSTDGKSPTISVTGPFALSLSKGERGVFRLLLELVFQKPGLFQHRHRVEGQRGKLLLDVGLEFGTRDPHEGVDLLLFRHGRGDRG